MNDVTRVSCAQCSATNRVPSARLRDQPVCGRCKAKLFSVEPLELDEAGFDAFVRNNDLPVLVDFWAPWCGPCRTMAPTFKAAAAQLEPTVRLVKVDTEAHPQLGARFNIRSIPTLALFRGGREVSRQSGALPMTQLMQFVRQSGGSGNGFA